MNVDFVNKMTLPPPNLFSEPNIISEIITCTENCPGLSCNQGEAHLECHQRASDLIEFFSDWMVVNNPYVPVDFSSNKLSDSPHFSKLLVGDYRKVKDGLYLPGKNLSCVDTVNELKQTFFTACKQRINNNIDIESNTNEINTQSRNADLNFLLIGVTLAGIALVGWATWKYYKAKFKVEEKRLTTQQDYKTLAIDSKDKNLTHERVKFDLINVKNKA